VRNWVEELAWEWLLLKGYMAIPNVRLKSGRGGGTKEADVIGLKLVRDKGEVLEIVHVETGTLDKDFKENLKSTKSKFSSERIKTIKDILLDIVELESMMGKARVDVSRVSKVEYKPIYIASYVAKKQVDDLKRELKKNGIEFKTLEEFLGEIIEDIDKWKQGLVDRGLRTTTGVTLPESWWLLNLIDSMKNISLIKTRKFKKSK